MDNLKMENGEMRKECSMFNVQYSMFPFTLQFSLFTFHFPQHALLIAAEAEAVDMGRGFSAFTGAVRAFVGDGIKFDHQLLPFDPVAVDNGDGLQAEGTAEPAPDPVLVEHNAIAFVDHPMPFSGINGFEDVRTVVFFLGSIDDLPGEMACRIGRQHS